MPQKLVLIYEAKLKDENGNADGTVTRQLTLHIPTFTKSSSILRTITEVLTLMEVRKAHHHGESHHGAAGKARGGKGG